MKILQNFRLKDINTDLLRETAERIYFFGLGFIQVKINESDRFHFYTSALPAFVETPHNHRYDFVSKVLSGTFENHIFVEKEPNEGDIQYIVEQESCREGEKPPQNPKVVSLVNILSTTYLPGQSYFMDHNTLHTVKGHEAITFLSRSAYRKEFADVSRPIGEEVKCPFSLKIPVKDLWEIIDTMIKKGVAGG